MKAVGIVAEYNPFHKGHEYQLREARRLSGCETVVSVMSGDFVQRGEAAVFDKHVRARAALECGVDLVFELPLPWALSSAEGFARGAVGILAATGAVSALSFGSECGSSERLAALATAIDSPEAQSLIVEKLRSGISYPAAREAAMAQLVGDGARLLASPNDILGIEYIRALRSLGANMQICPVERIGAGHDCDSDGAAPRSASQLRRLMLEGGDWQSHVPNQAREIFSREKPVDRKFFEIAVMSRLRMLARSEYNALPDAAEGLGDRLYAAVQSGGTLEAVLAVAKSKRYTMSRLRRMLMCAALGIRRGMNSGTPEYIRVLAASEQGLTILAQMRESAKLPVITKPAHGRKLTGRAGECFALCASARDLYVLATETPEPGSDFKLPPNITKVTKRD
jgi:predicted nucleotidyltransferase